MGKIYSWDENPFQDFLLILMINGADISNKNLEVDIYVRFLTILEYFSENKRYDEYLDFEIKKNDIRFKVIPKNILTALWLSGISPQNFENVLNSNKFRTDNGEYRFNEKTKRLTYKIIETK